MKRPELSPQLGSSFQAKCSNCHPNFIKPYPMKHELPVFALLIDADNVNKEAIVPIIEEVTRHGRIAVRRVYGDFTTPHLAGWRETLANHGIHPIQQYRNSVGKNASDSALIIDAMDLLHSGRFEGFCLVSSDGDFTRLATRIREDGLSVFGFGRKDAAKAFVNACERYIYIENLLNPPEIVKEATPAPAKDTSLPKPTASADPPPQPEAPKPSVNDESSKQAIVKVASPADTERLKKLLSRAYTNVTEENGWALVSRIEQYLRANHSDFDPRSYGASTFPKLLNTLDVFEVVQRKQGNGNAQFCRQRKRPAAYVDALKAAVSASKSADGWSGIADIRVYLHKNGHRQEDSGLNQVVEALKATRNFDMRDAGGTNKDFRLSPASR